MNTDESSEACFSLPSISRYFMLMFFLFTIARPNCGYSQQSETDGWVKGDLNAKLGSHIPLDLEFSDEEGNNKTLEEIAGGKPFVLSLVYYRCPGICNHHLSAIAEVIGRSDLEPGKDYEFLSISFDPSDTPELARQKKANYLPAIERKIDNDGWHFLSGNQENVDRLTKAVGFTYKKLEDGTFTHSTALIAVSPKGKIARILPGSTSQRTISFLPVELKMAVMEASQGKVSATAARILRYCFSFEPEGFNFTLNFLRVMGVLITLTGIGFFTYLVKSSKKYRTS